MSDKAKILNEWRDWMNKSGFAARTAEGSIDSVALWFRRSEDSRLALKEVTSDHISSYINQNYSNQTTAALVLAHLKAFFDYCLAKGLASQNPARLVRLQHPGVQGAKKSTPTCLSVEEAELLISQLPGFWKVAAAFAFHGGLEFRHVVTLKWSSFKKTGYVTVTDAEERTQTEISFTPEMQNAMATVQRGANEKDDSYCFPEEKRMHDSPASRSNLSVYFGRQSKSVGVNNARFSDLRRHFYQRRARAERQASLGSDLYDFSSVKNCQTAYACSPNQPRNVGSKNGD